MLIFLSTTAQMGSNSSGWAMGLQSQSKCCLARAVITKSKLEPREKCNSSCMAKHRGQLAASPKHLFLSPKSLLPQTSFTLQKNHLEAVSDDCHWFISCLMLSWLDLVKLKKKIHFKWHPAFSHNSNPVWTNFLFFLWIGKKQQNDKS